MSTLTAINGHEYTHDYPVMSKSDLSRITRALEANGHIRYTTWHESDGMHIYTSEKVF